MHNFIRKGGIYMASTASSSNIIDYYVGIVYRSVEYLLLQTTIIGRVKTKLKLKDIWTKCGIKTSSNADGIPILKGYRDINYGYLLVFKLPIGLCLDDLVQKKEKIKYALKLTGKAEDIDIAESGYQIKIKVTTVDRKALFS